MPEESERYAVMVTVYVWAQDGNDAIAEVEGFLRPNVGGDFTIEHVART